MKRALCIILVAAMVFGFMPMFGIQSFAATNDTEMDFDELTQSSKHTIDILRVTLDLPEEGKELSALQAQVEGNATFTGISVYNDKLGNMQETGVFEPLTNYQVFYHFQPVEGYVFSNEDTEVGFNNDIYAEVFNIEPEELTVLVYFSTCQKIQTMELSMPQIVPGMNRDEAVLTAEENANYEIVEYYFTSDGEDLPEDWTTFESGYNYHLNFSLEAKEGYAFAEDSQAFVNGEDAHFFPWGNLERGDGWQEYQLEIERKKITKVEFPAQPKSLSKGKTLPTNFKVTGKDYTFSFEWARYYNDGVNDQNVTKTDKNDIYFLYFYAYPNEGYEFSEDVTVYIGGKKTTSTLVSTNEDYVTALKIYNVGVKKIDKVELTTSLVKPGVRPTITAPEGAKYTLADSTWFQSKENSLDEAYEVEQLEKDLYAFAGVFLVPAEGYAFSDSVSFYVNGKKVSVSSDRQQNYLIQTIAFLPLGKVTMPKLTTPKLSKSDTVISWNAVEDATGYEIYRATSKSGKYALVTTVTETSFQDTVEAGKTYYYKVKAVCSEDTSRNSAQSSYISVAYKCPEPVISVTNADSGKPYISWEKVSGAQKYTVYRSSSENGKYSKLASTTKPYYTDTKAKVGISYFYKVVSNGSSSTYTSYYSNAAGCMVICAAPSVSVKIDSATGRPSLSWSKITGASKYAIYRQLPGEETFTLLCEQTATSYADKTAPIDTECQYYVQTLGKTEDLNSAASKVVTATSGIAKPDVKGSIDAVTGKPVLTWEAIEGAVKYEIYRSTKSNKSYTLLATVETLTYTDETVSAGKTYYYKVKAIGEVSKSADSSYDKLTGKCATPELFVENAENGKPCLKWYKVSGAKKYTVYRATSETGKYTKLGTTTKLTYTDTKASAGTTYFYKIVANGSKSSYNSGYSNVVSCGVICGTPSVTVKIDANTGKPSLSWGKVSGAAKYAVYRDGELLATVTTVTYADTTAAIDTQYTYTVQALGKTEDLNGAVSKAVTATSGIAKPVVKGTITDQGKPQLTWEAVEGAVKYEVYRSTKSNKGYVLLGDAYSTGVDDMSVAPGKTYYYQVRAIGEVSKSANSSYVKLTGKCAAPVITVENDSNGKPVISWSKVSGAKKYTIYRATTETGTYKSLGTTTKTSYTDSKATADTVYYYKVIANGSKSSYNSVYSNVCRTPAPAADTDGVMTYAEYMAAELETPVVIECYVQATQSWWEGGICVYAQDRDGGYYIHNMACTEADAARLTAGTKIRVSGTKSEWCGEVEILEATFEFIDGADTFIAGPLDVTDLLGTDALEQHMNKKVTFKGMTVKSIEYKYEEPGDDIYVTLTKDGADFKFCIERYLTDPETEVYQKVCQLKSGDVVDLEGFLYWYEGPYTHITSVTVK